MIIIRKAFSKTTLVSSKILIERLCFIIKLFDLRDGARRGMHELSSYPLRSLTAGPFSGSGPPPLGVLFPHLASRLSSQPVRCWRSSKEEQRKRKKLGNKRNSGSGRSSLNILETNFLLKCSRWHLPRNLRSPDMDANGAEMLNFIQMKYFHYCILRKWS